MKNQIESAGLDVDNGLPSILACLALIGLFSVILVSDKLRLSEVGSGELLVAPKTEL